MYVQNFVHTSDIEKYIYLIKFLPFPVSVAFPFESDMDGTFKVLQSHSCIEHNTLRANSSSRKTVGPLWK